MSGTLESLSEIIVSLGDFDGHVGKYAEGFEGVHQGNDIGKRNAEGRRLLEFCNEEVLYVASTWFYKAHKKKITYIAKQILILCCGRKIQKVYKGCKSDSMGTSAQAGGRRSG